MQQHCWVQHSSELVHPIPVIILPVCSTGYEPEEGLSGGEPGNIDDIQAALRASRSSLSPSRFSDSAFKEFKRKTVQASGETSARMDIISMIQGDAHRAVRHGGDHLFNHLEPLDKELPTPKPDHYDGALPQSIDYRVRRDLDKHIVPCNNTARPAVPNLVLEAKGDSGRADVLKRQATHHGALGARAIHSLENYGAEEERHDGHAKSFSSTYHHGTSTLALYAHHTTAPKVPGGRTEYHMTKLRGYDMTSDRETFQKGAGAIRNLRDLSRTHRDSAINHANRAARHAPDNSPSTVLTDSRTSLSALQEDPSDTSTDELSMEYTSQKRSRHTAQALSRHTAVTSGAAPLTSLYSRHAAKSCDSSLPTTRREQSVQSNTVTRHSSEDGISKRKAPATQERRDRHAEDPRERRR